YSGFYFVRLFVYYGIEFIPGAASLCAHRAVLFACLDWIHIIDGIHFRSVRGISLLGRVGQSPFTGCLLLPFPGILYLCQLDFKNRSA
ncbi:hypothetical protein L9G15_22760, partial [Shewanella sp. A3A]|nr:hypothetical protein [Shewanella ferrihydritica]